VDSERTRYAGGQLTHNIWRVKNDGDGDGKHQELDESGDLAGKPCR
jgi:hypothetical protein